MKISRSFTFVYICAVLWIVSGCQSKVTEQQLQNAVANLSQSRSVAEDITRRAKQDTGIMSRSGIVREKYSLAMAKGNAIIDVIQFNLTSGNLKNASVDQYVKELENALKELDEATKASGSVGLIGFNLDVGSLISGMTDAAVTIWKAKKENDAQKQQELEVFFETLRWKEWDEIE